MNDIFEAKLNASDRKDLDDSEFGLPSDRKFPINDEEHVRKAIQFFKYCPVNKRSELAKNINKKIKEFDMDIEVSRDNPYYTYANRLAAKLKESFSDNTASNPKVNKLISYIKDYRVYTNDDMVKLDRYVCNCIGDAIEYSDINELNDMMCKKYKEYFSYMYYSDDTDWSLSYDLCEYAAPNIVKSINDNKPISKYLSLIENHVNTLHAYRSILAVCRYMLENFDDVIHHTKDGYVYNQWLQVKLTRDRLVSRISNKVVIGSSVGDDIFTDKYSCLNVYKDILGFIKDNIKSQLRDINNVMGIKNYKNSIVLVPDYERGRYHGILSYHINPDIVCGFGSEPKTTHIDSEDLLLIRRIKQVPVEVIQGSDINGDPVYFAIYHRADSKPDHEDSLDVFIVTKSTADKNIYYMIDISNYDTDNMLALCDVQYKEYTKPPMVYPCTYNRVDNTIACEAKLKSININDKGDIKIEIAPDKSYMDSYSENHKFLDSNWKNRNLDAMKENLCYVFALISIIERSEEYKRRESEAVKARAFAINDFKTYLKHLQTEEPNFDFSRYYIDSEYDKKVINIPKSTIVGVKKIIRAILV